MSRNCSTHGGSLRIYGCHESAAARPAGARVRDLLECERAAGYEQLETYLGFDRRIEIDKRQILGVPDCDQEQWWARRADRATAKGNTLLNYCGVRSDFLDYTVDLNPYKQGCFLPGSRIPIRAPHVIGEDRPDVVLILPWNLSDEIVQQLAAIREWVGALPPAHQI